MPLNACKPRTNASYLQAFVSAATLQAITTQETDKTNIFKAIAESRDLQSEEGQLRLHRNLVRANQTLHSTLAILAWPQAMHKNLLPTRHAKGLRPGALNVCEALFNDTFREFLNLSLAHFDESCTDSVVKSLAESLPLSLLKLKLSFEGCSRLTDLSLQALSTAFAQPETQRTLFGLRWLSEPSRMQAIVMKGWEWRVQEFKKSEGFESLFLKSSQLTGLCFVSHSTKLDIWTSDNVHPRAPPVSRGTPQIQLGRIGVALCGLYATSCSWHHGIKGETCPRPCAPFKGSFKGTSINRNFRDLNEFEEIQSERQKAFHVFVKSESFMNGSLTGVGA